MRTSRTDSRGFTLIAALLLTVLLSGLAVGLLFMVSNEARMGGNDLEGNLAYYGAEAGIENLTSEIAQLYQTSQTPNAAAINQLWQNSQYYPTAIAGSNLNNITFIPNITWPATQTNGLACPNAPNPCGSWDIVGSGPDQGMVASLIPFTLQVTATRNASAGQSGTNSVLAASGASVNLTRTVEVALLPAFEFGVFCDGDCDYFAGPPFNFGGRVHTNGNLFLASGATLTFTDKIAAVNQVVMDQLENGHPTNNGYTGQVVVPSAAGACPPAPAAGPVAPSCNQLGFGSYTGGFPPVGAISNVAGWVPESKTTFAGFILNGTTGAKKLQLPFVQSTPVGAIEIIRKPTPADSTLLTNSRLYSEASIRIMLADTEGDLYPGEARADAATQDIQIGTPYTNVATITAGNGNYSVAATAVTPAGNMYFATAKSGGAQNWTTNAPTGCNAALAFWPLFGQVTVAGKQCQGTWLRVEYLSTATNTWVGVTTQWLAYGFGRNYNQPPTHPWNSSVATAPLCGNYPNLPTAAAPQCQNGISPAILILQQLQGTVAAGSAMGAGTVNNWLPINFYDAREGEPRDVRPAGDTGIDCSPNGIMNAVELDVGNLWLWLQGAAPYVGGAGTLVSNANFNGYIVYFDDHRGMIPDAHPFPGIPFNNGFSGMSGLNDVVNSGSVPGIPDAKLEAITYYATATPTPYSPEDTAIKGNGKIDNWGQANLGAGFGIAAGSMSQPYYVAGTTTNAVQCYSYSGSVSEINGAPKMGNPTLPIPGVATAEWNMVTGPRHALRLVDAGMDNKGNSFLPHPIAPATTGNGFTVASEEPVYVWGDYNTGLSDPFWPSENVTTTPHSAAAIIADSVTLLSNPPNGATAPVTNTGWTDFESFAFPAISGDRPGNTSYYRMAIAAGKNVPFPEPAFGVAAGWNDMGTDGGMHNFLRYLEQRGANGAQVNYAGSMVSMYYSQYNTGIFKCCNSVYGAPQRNYFFDTQFLNPANLPPGTPQFQDVVSLSYHQSFTPQ
jgi:PilX N-terminal